MPINPQSGSNEERPVIGDPRPDQETTQSDHYSYATELLRLASTIPAVERVANYAGNVLTGRDLEFFDVAARGRRMEIIDRAYRRFFDRATYDAGPNEIRHDPVDTPVSPITRGEMEWPWPDTSRITANRNCAQCGNPTKSGERHEFSSGDTFCCFCYVRLGYEPKENHAKCHIAKQVLADEPGLAIPDSEHTYKTLTEQVLFDAVHNVWNAVGTNEPSFLLGIPTVPNVEYNYLATVNASWHPGMTMSQEDLPDRPTRPFRLNQQFRNGGQLFSIAGEPYLSETTRVWSFPVIRWSDGCAVSEIFHFTEAYLNGTDTRRGDEIRGQRVEGLPDALDREGAVQLPDEVQVTGETPVDAQRTTRRDGQSRANSRVVGQMAESESRYRDWRGFRTVGGRR